MFQHLCTLWPIQNGRLNHIYIGVLINCIVNADTISNTIWRRDDITFPNQTAQCLSFHHAIWIILSQDGNLGRNWNRCTFTHSCRRNYVPRLWFLPQFQELPLPQLPSTSQPFFAQESDCRKP